MERVFLSTNPANEIDNTMLDWGSTQDDTLESNLWNCLLDMIDHNASLLEDENFNNFEE
jgi:hypothetical protein